MLSPVGDSRPPAGAVHRVKAPSLLRAAIGDLVAKARDGDAGNGRSADHGSGAPSVAWVLDGAAGTAAVGSYAEVAALFNEYAQLGVTEFVLSGYPQRVEIHHVGQGVLPLFAHAPAGV